MLEHCISCIITIIFSSSLFQELIYIRQPVEEPSLQLGDANRSSSSEEDDFFSALQSSQAWGGTQQLDGYLMFRPVQQITWIFLAVCKNSMKLNTSLPATAACKNLFSSTGLQPMKSKARFSQLWKTTSSEDDQTTFQLQLMTMMLQDAGHSVWQRSSP